jgi:hypothetical protein
VFLDWTHISIIQFYLGSEQDLRNFLNIHKTERRIDLQCHGIRSTKSTQLSRYSLVTHVTIAVAFLELNIRERIAQILQWGKARCCYVQWGCTVGRGAGRGGGEVVHSRDSTMHLQTAASVWCPVCGIQWHVRKQRVVGAAASMYSEFQKYNVLIRRGYKGLSTTREYRFFKTPCKQTQPKENKHQPTTRSGMHIDNKLR